MFNRYAFQMAMAALAGGPAKIPAPVAKVPPHMLGERRKTMYYYHHPRAHNAGSRPVPGGGIRERQRRVIREMLAQWKL